MKLIKKTKGRCPKCLKIVDASVFEKEDGVWIYGECDEHGKYKGFIEKDVEFYKKMMNDKGDVCPVQIVVIPITHKCNLNCKFCFVPKRKLREKTTDELKNEIRNIIKKTNTRAISFSGGEPTLREDLFELIKFVKNEYPSKMTFIVTNGVKLADLNYVKKLKESGLDAVNFSFNGFDDKVYQKTNNAKLLDIKLKALENLKKVKIMTAVSPTIVRGVNEKDIKPIIEYAMNNLDFIFEVRIRGGANVGKHNKINPLTASEMFGLVADALCKDKSYFLRKFSRNDCYHSIQQFLITLLIDNSKNKKEILNFIYGGYAKNTIGNKIKMMNIILKILFRRGIKKFWQAICKSKILSPAQNYKIKNYGWYLFFFDKLDFKPLHIKIWWWVDETNVDLDEMKTIGILHTTYDGRILPIPDATIIADEL